jgi:phage terminase large subunit
MRSVHRPKTNKMDLNVTGVFRRNWEAIHAVDENGQRKYKYIINSGSSRSSKTYSLIDCYDLYARKNPNKRMTAWRSTKKDCKDTIMVDFLKRLKLTERFKTRQFNITESIYKYPNSSVIEFRGTDEESVFGLTQDCAWLNEPYSISKDVFDQIDQRTSDFVFIDLNPKDNHWSDDLMAHPRALVLHSTFEDNPFCPPEQRLKILSYDPSVEENIKNKTANLFKWQVYGLGLKGEVEGKVFSNYEIIDEIPKTAKFYGYGLDFGYTNDPSALIKIYDYNDSVILEEVIYSNGLKNSVLAREMKRLKVNHNDLIIADSSAPLIIDELFDEGFSNIHPCVKGSGSIVYGIEIMKDLNILIPKSSTNLIYEFDNYKNAKNKFGKYINEPDKGQQDHAIDAARYGLTDKMTRNNFFVI